MTFCFWPLPALNEAKEVAVRVTALISCRTLGLPKRLQRIILSQSIKNSLCLNIPSNASHANAWTRIFSLSKIPGMHWKEGTKRGMTEKQGKEGKKNGRMSTHGVAVVGKGWDSGIELLMLSNRHKCKQQFRPRIFGPMHNSNTARYIGRCKWHFFGLYDTAMTVSDGVQLAM